MSNILINIKEYYELSENQSRMILIWVVAFLCQATILYLFYPDNFNTKWFLLALSLNIMYNISFYKLFSS